MKNRGLDYLLKEEDRTLHVGCKITGSFYETQSAFEINGIVSELANMAKYTPIPVIINGRTINKPASEEKWTHETDDAYMSLTSGATLAVYNLGVLVRTFPASQLGAGGVIVSKEHLDLNIARNDILVSTCSRWKRIKEFVRKNAVVSAKKKTSKLTNERRESLLRQFMAGDLELEDLEGIKLLPTVKGYIELRSLRVNAREWTIPRRQNDTIAEHIHREGAALVLSPDISAWFDYRPAAEIAAAFAERFESERVEQLFTEWAQLERGYSREVKPVERKDLSLQQKGVVSALKAMNWYLSSAAGRARKEIIREREIQVGILDGALAWTDGRRYIGFHLETIANAAKSERQFDSLPQILLHEYCHNDITFDRHNHDLEFYELFHDALRYVWIPDVVARGKKAYCSYMRNNEKKAPAWAQRGASKGVLEDEIAVDFHDDDDVESDSSEPTDAVASAAPQLHLL